MNTHRTVGALRPLHPEACGINANGHHYVRRGTSFLWVHPSVMTDDDCDCSFMSDAEFDEVVAEVTA